MSTISYEVVGEHSAPDDFESYALTLRAQRKRVPITAQQVTVDELAARRGQNTAEISFEFLIAEMHPLDDGYALGGFMYTNEVRGNWIMIEVTDRVRFDVFD